MSLKSFNITPLMTFFGVYMVGIYIAGYLTDIIGITGLMATALSLTVVFLIAGYALGYRLNIRGWLIFIIFGFISSFITGWATEAMALSGPILTFLSAFILYFLVSRFGKAAKGI